MSLAIRLHHEADDLMAVEASVTPTRYVNPEYLAIGGLEDELVEISIVSNPF